MATFSCFMFALWGQVFDAGEKLSIAIVEPTEYAVAQSATRDEGQGGGRSVAAGASRKVVTRDDFVHSGDEIFLVDREL